MTIATKKKRWIASYERMIARDELGRLSILETEFSNWVKNVLSKLRGYCNISIASFEELDRILDVDVEFDYAGSEDLFPVDQPSFDGWMVVQVKQIDEPFRG